MDTLTSEQTVPGIQIATSEPSILLVIKRKEEIPITCRVSGSCGTCLSRDYSNSSQMPACEVHLGLPPLQRGNTHRVGGKPRFPTRSFDCELALQDKWRRESGILSRSPWCSGGGDKCPCHPVHRLSWFMVYVTTFLF